MSFAGVLLKPLLEVFEVVTIHYFEYGCDFSFSGESHDFWEFLCVDKGEVEVVAGEVPHTLKRGDIIFHEPDEFHCLTANHRVAPNLVVVSFRCDSPAMDFFRGRILTVDDRSRELLARIIAEAGKAFRDPLDDPYQTHMELREDIPVGALQAIRLYRELLLLHLLRQFDGQSRIPTAGETVRRRKDESDYHRVVAYLEEHLSCRLTLEQIARETMLGRSRLQQLIRRYHDCGVMELFARLKTDCARQLIRENRLNFTEIADLLGYSSIHYFSRQFKKQTGMTPSEYSSSIKGRSERRDA